MQFSLSHKTAEMTNFSGQCDIYRHLIQVVEKVRNRMNIVWNEMNACMERCGVVHSHTNNYRKIVEAVKNASWEVGHHDSCTAPHTKFFLTKSIQQRYLHMGMRVAEFHSGYR